MQYDAPLPITVQINQLQTSRRRKYRNDTPINLHGWRVVLEYLIVHDQLATYGRLVGACWAIFHVGTQLETLDGAVWDGMTAVHYLGLANSRRDLGNRGFVDTLRSRHAHVLDRNMSSGDYCVLSPVHTITLLLSDSPTRYGMPDQSDRSDNEAAVEYVAGAANISIHTPIAFTPFPFLRRVTLIPTQEAHPERRPVRLFFAQPTSAGVPVLRCLTGSLDRSPMSLYIQRLLRTEYSSSLCIHLDRQTMGSNFQMFWYTIPLPSEFRHLGVSFPTFEARPDLTRGVTGQEFNDEVRERVAWLRAIVRHLQERQQEPILLEIIGLYAFLNTWDAVRHIGNEWDGMPRIESVDCTAMSAAQRFDSNIVCPLVDGTYNHIVKDLIKKSTLTPHGTYPSIDAAIDELPTPAKGEVFLAFRHTSVGLACQACEQPYSTLSPFSPLSIVPAGSVTSRQPASITVFRTEVLRGPIRAT